jgi:hypothetical protein
MPDRSRLCAQRVAGFAKLYIAEKPRKPAAATSLGADTAREGGMAVACDRATGPVRQRAARRSPRVAHAGASQRRDCPNSGLAARPPGVAQERREGPVAPRGGWKPERPQQALQGLRRGPAGWIERSAAQTHAEVEATRAEAEPNRRTAATPTDRAADPAHRAAAPALAAPGFASPRLAVAAQQSRGREPALRASNVSASMRPFSS